MRIASPVVLLALFALTACGDDTPAAAPPSSAPPPTSVADGDGAVGPAVVEGSWRLVDGTFDGTQLVLVDGFDVTLDLTLEPDGASIGGRAACNSYGGEAQIGDDGSFVIGPLAATEMACEPPVMDVERALLAALPTITGYEVAGGRLVLTGPATTLTFDPVAPVPVADVVGTTWVLETVMEGDVATSAPAATLRLDVDGSLAGSTGCRRLAGEWIESGAEIVFTTFSAIDDPAAGVCAPDAERLDGVIVTVLGDGFTAEVDGDRLTITSRGGDGLVYGAEP